MTRPLVASERPALITLDVGGTLGKSDRPGLTSALLAASPLARRDATVALRDRLHVVSSINDQVVTDVCRALRIPISAFPRHLTAAPLRLYPATRRALPLLHELLPLVTLSNVTCVDTDPEQLDELLRPWVTGHFPSYRIGHAKPEPRAFHAAAHHAGVNVAQIIHIGDNWECDTLGAANAGASTVWISGGRPTPPIAPPLRRHVAVAHDLTDAVTHVRTLCARRPA
ncbi:HAD-IA family hydrolase [Actinoplanes sp. NPDC051346]|uniref:HAD family hydrolase n=1 Tax=Actinoplanes sp. NPDC051346 TaxID=3155048 RepID=UPI00341626FE